LIVINVISLNSSAIDPSATALVGIVVLALGVILGGLAAGLIGGRRGGLFAGPIAGLLFAGSLTGLRYWLDAQGRLPSLLVAHPIRTMGALLFLGAIIAGLAVCVAALLSWRANSTQALQTFQSEQRPSARAYSAAPSHTHVGEYTQPERRDAPPTRRIEHDVRDFTPAPRRNLSRPLGSDSRANPARPAYPAHSASGNDTRYDTRYDQEERRPETPGRW
jgi:hypothetical protein